MAYRVGYSYIFNNVMKRNKINIPTKITLTRIIAILVMLLGLGIYEIICYAYPPAAHPPYLGNTSINLVYFIIFILFVLAALTDMLDGKLARKWNQVTDLGKFLDPVADKLLINSMIIFLCVKHVYAQDNITFNLACAIIIIARDIVVDCLRFVAAKKNVVIAANIFGKAKTVAQMITIPLVLLDGWPFSLFDKTVSWWPEPVRIVSFFMYITTVISLISGVIYVVQNRKVFASE